MGVMTFRVYNTRTHRLETFQSQKPKVVTMYNCGPTVYGVPSIGNYRSFLFADLLRRHLEQSGYAVKQVMNITDVGHLLNDADEGEDKLESQARKEKKDPWEISRHYTSIFFDERRAIHMKEPMESPRATDNIAQMISMIETLIRNGHAYVIGNNVYFSVASFPQYGALSGNTLEQLNAGARIEVNEEKRHPHDFALWKSDPKHIMQWDSPWGRGFPGWHIECSAMSMRYLGETLDIHTGGEDNIFPHHECEIAQSEGATGKMFSRYWMHARFLLVNGEKMSKSKGNFFLLKDLTDKGYDMRAIRYALMAAQYRQPLNFTLEALDAATKATARLDECYEVIKQPTRKAATQELLESTEVAKTKFKAGLDDDLNISEALAALFTRVTDINRIKVAESDAETVSKTWSQFDEWLGFVSPWNHDEKVPEAVAKLLAEREKARASKDFKRSDQLRDEISKLGYTVKDSPQGQQLRRKS
jgi:cysteinyl-tRNA synthetase